jgi:PAS domain S-box-containing protein/putative nucleotidyltransferase with HDIG domain
MAIWKTILLVDDDTSFQNTLTDILTAKGFHVVCHSQGKSAIEQVEDLSPMVAFIDQKLDDMPGLEVVEKIKERSPNTECIVLTGHASQASAIDAINLGVYSFLQKPCDIEQLMVMLQRAVERKNALDAVQASERQYRVTLDSMEAAIHVIDGDMRITLMNAPCAEWMRELGLDTDVIGRDLFDAFPFLPENVRDEYQCVLLTGETLVSEENLEIGGDKILTETKKVPLIQEDRIDRVVTVVRDITADKLAEEALETSYQELQLMDEINRALLYQEDFDQIIQKVVDAFRELCQAQVLAVYLYDRLERCLILHTYEPRRGIIDKIEKVIGLSVSKFAPILRDSSRFMNALESGKSFIITEPDEIAALYAEFTDNENYRKNIRTVMKLLQVINTGAVPLVSAEGPLGLITFSTTQTPTPQDLERIERFGKQVATALSTIDVGKRVRESEERYRTIFETTAVSIWEEDFSAVGDAIEALKSHGVTDFAAYLDQHPEFVQRASQMIKVQDVNQTTLKLLGAKDKEELLGYLDKVFVPETLEILRDEILAIAEGRTYFEGETINRTLQGEELHILLTMSIPADVNKLDSVLVSMMDITQRKRAEETARQIEGRYRNLFDGVPVGLYRTTPGGHIADVNLALVEMLGYPDRETLLSVNAEELFLYPMDRQREWAMIAGDGVLMDYELQLRRYDGEVIWVKDNSQGFFDEEGNLIFCEGSIENITERKRTQGDLMVSEERYRRLVEALPDGVVTTDLDGLITFVSGRTLELHGYSDAEELLGKSFLELIAPVERRSTFENMRKTLRDGIVQDAEYTMSRKDGSQFIGQVSSALIKDAQGEPSAFITITHNVTERVKAEQDLRRRAEEFSVLYATTRDLAGSQDLLPLLDTIIDRAIRLLDTPCGGIYLFDAEQDELELSVAKGYPLPIGNRMKLGEGMAGRVAQTREPMLVDDYQDWEYRNPKYERVPFSSVLEVPMLYAGELIGILVVNELTPTIRTFTESDIHLLSLFAAQAAASVHSARLFEQATHRLAELESVSRVSTALRVAETLDEILPLFVDQALAVVESGVGALWLYDEEEDILRAVATRDWSGEVFKELVRPGEGLTGKVYSTGEMHISPQFLSDPDIVANIRSDLPEGWGGAWIPIYTTQAVVGVFVVAVSLPRQLSQEELNILNILSEIAGNAIQRMRLFQQTQRSLERLSALRSIDMAITASLDLRVTLNIFLEQVMEQLGVDAVDVLLFDRYMQTLEYSVGRGFRSSMASRSNLRLRQDQVGRAIMDGQILYFPDLTEPADLFAREELLSGEGFVSYCAAPLVSKGQIMGLMELFHRKPFRPSNEWMDFLETLAGQAAIVLDNAALFDEVQHSNIELTLAYDATIEGWSRALELRDMETVGHSQRVTDLTVRLARVVGMSEADVVHVRRGALLHDIGKMAIPDSILNKTGPLDEEEWVLMRKHPVYAYELLSPIPFLRQALDIPYAHHEKWDGTGYPRGLMGKHIPLSARVFAVVDVWDALNSDRPYRSAWAEEDILAYLHDQSGEHFDPEIVPAFLDLLHSGVYKNI